MFLLLFAGEFFFRRESLPDFKKKYRNFLCKNSPRPKPDSLSKIIGNV